MNRICSWLVTVTMLLGLVTAATAQPMAAGTGMDEGVMNEDKAMDDGMAPTEPMAPDEESWGDAEMQDCVKMMMEDGYSEDEANTECEAILNEDLWDQGQDEGMEPGMVDEQSGDMMEQPQDGMMEQKDSGY